MKKILAPILLILLFFIVNPTKSQISLGGNSTQISYSKPLEYEIGGIKIEGIKYLDNNVLIMLSGLNVGESITVPGEDITGAIRKLWKQGLFSDVKISVNRIIGGKIFLTISLKERPRLSKYKLTGMKKSQADDIRENINLTTGDVVTDNLLMRTRENIKKYYTDKGYLNADIEIKEIPDTTRLNNVILHIDVDKNNRIRIAEINIYGNKHLSADQIKSAMKETKEEGMFQPFSHVDSLLIHLFKSTTSFNLYGIVDDFQEYFVDSYKIRIFKGSKYIKTEFEEDKAGIIHKYNQKGYRDARIVKDSIFKENDRAIGLDLWVDEGNRYYFGEIEWIGNTKYSDKELNNILKIRKGDIYNKELLETNLSFNPNGFDVSSLYLDDGYLFFQANPVEVKVENDTIHLEIRIHEGDQAIINSVTVKGNTQTNDHVVYRELYTKPGQLFSRADIIRTQRQLANLRYFNAETLGIDYTPNPQDGTVDIIYEVEETSSDQIELSGGWGYGRIVGTLGLSFNNFSLRNIFNFKTYRPIPTGDGQKLGLRFQTYGKGYFNYNISFTEPWLGGKKPNSFTFSFYQSFYSSEINDYYNQLDDNQYSKFKNTGVSIGLGKRLTWPDDWFTLMQSINLQHYDLQNYGYYINVGDGNGSFFNISYAITLARKSTDSPLYPRTGSDLSIGLEITPPYSWFSGIDYSSPDVSDNEKYKWIEYHKWSAKAGFYTNIIDDLVLVSKFQFGFLGSYNKKLGLTPFERYYLGGDGLYGYNVDGREVIAMRGYQNESITPNYAYDHNIGGTIYDKFTFELRYPLSLNPTATIYALTYLEAGNDWSGFETFNPFAVYKSAGIGIRVFLPMFGMLGLDWGYGFDEIPGMPDANGSQFHFSINNSID